MPVVGSPLVGSDLDSVRVVTKYLTWIKQEFKPLTLATPDVTIVQSLENAIRYWNTHSGYKWIEMVDCPSNKGRVQLSTNIKTVVEVYPASNTTWIWKDHPMWTILGVTMLDNITADLIMMSEAFKNYRIYVGSDFRWTSIKSEDPSVGGYLYVKNAPKITSKLCVIGTKRIIATEDIKQEYILDWILSYTKALVSIIEGNTLRKAAIVNVKNDGQELLDRGFEQKEKLQEQLSKDSRWVVLARRF